MSDVAKDQRTTPAPASGNKGKARKSTAPSVTSATGPVSVGSVGGPRTLPPLPQAVVPKPISNRTALRRSIPQRTEGKSPLQLTLSHLHQVLVRRDRHCFFQTPITDELAPGYGKVIKFPMDFSVMARKILEGIYESVGEYRDDFRLMCENAMNYNSKESVYYDEAEKLLSMGVHKVLTRQRVRAMRRSFNFVRELSEEQISLSPVRDIPDLSKKATAASKPRTNTSSPPSFPDAEMSNEMKESPQVVDQPLSVNNNSLDTHVDPSLPKPSNQQHSNHSQTHLSASSSSFPPTLLLVADAVSGDDALDVLQTQYMSSCSNVRTPVFFDPFSFPIDGSSDNMNGPSYDSTHFTKVLADDEYDLLNKYHVAQYGFASAYPQKQRKRTRDKSLTSNYEPPQQQPRKSTNDQNHETAK